ncbi:MAG TPA: galactose-1-phosphate uridylyltransferase [Candidatus Omnitrophica bacterium]|nr:galactose-1-phosphate uridylyltransferase [Candidatus Omnitrophota bacterium]
MSELRRDPIVGRWVIVNVEDPKAPKDFHIEPHHYDDATNCPFCYGNEHMTPPEIQAFRHEKTHVNKQGWQVRVVPNKFPALQIEGELDRHGLGIFDMSNGIGAHEVIIETPYHTKDISDLEQNEIEKILEMYSLRSKDLEKDKRFKYILLFKNFGSSAGATIDHNHTQLIALPMIPKNVLEELNGSNEYFEYRDRCIFCDIIHQELEEKERVLEQSKNFIAFCPYVSRSPFEIWIMPRAHKLSYCDISKEELSDLAKMLKDVLRRMKTALNDPPYNFIIHTSPINGEDRPGYHWHIEIMPRLSRLAGFEWGTGFYVVSTPPEVAIKYLKEIKL